MTSLVCFHSCAADYPASTHANRANPGSLPNRKCVKNDEKVTSSWLGADMRTAPKMKSITIFIAAVMLLYMLSTRLRGREIDIRCLDKIAQYLFYIFVIDFSLEMLDLLQR